MNGRFGKAVTTFLERVGWKKVGLAVGFVALLGLSSLVGGMGGGPAVEQPAGPTIDLVGLILRLGVVLVLIYVSLAGLRTYLARQGGRAGNANAIKVLEKSRLGPQQTLYLVAVDDRALLLGATATSLTSLADLGTAERFLTGLPEESTMPFSQHLQTFGFTFPFATGNRAGDRQERDG
ncbi:MAG: FliO/MopB family protein [Chloroflexota bacterium]